MRVAVKNLLILSFSLLVACSKQSSTDEAAAIAVPQPTTPVTTPMAPAPTVSSIFPNSWGGGGAQVVITGTNFQTAATVNLSGISCTSVVVVSSTQITCITGARGAGLANVTVINPDQQSGTLVGGFNYQSFYYVTNQGNGKVSAFNQDPITGQLNVISGSPFVTGGSGTYGVAIDPSNRFLFAVNYSSNNVMAFAINPDTGALTQIGALATGSGPACAVISPDGKYLYVTNYGTTTLSAFSIDQTTGALTSLGNTPAGGSNPNRIIIDPSGSYLMVDNFGSNNITVFSIEKTNGSLTAIGSYSTGPAPDGMTIDLSGKYLFIANSGNNSLSVFSINSGTGTLTLFNNYPIDNANGGAGVDIDPNSKYIYATSYAAGTVSGFSINMTDGSLSSVGPSVAASSGANDLSFSATGNFTYVTNTTSNSLSAYSVNPLSGALTLLNTYTGLNQPGMTVSTK